MSRIGKAVIVVALAFGAFVYAQSQMPQDGRLTWVIDGDTIIVGKDHVRLWGIDAPEVDTKEGQIARGFLRGALKVGERIRCERKDTDNYGRIVATCFTDQGVDIAGLMLMADQACEWRRFSKGYYSRIAKCQRLPGPGHHFAPERGLEARRYTRD